MLVWVTTDFTVPDDFVTWTKNGKEITATFNEHSDYSAHMNEAGSGY